MRVILVNMPWGAVDMPSLALGILKKVTNERLPDIDVDVVFGNIDYVDWITERRPLSVSDYNFFSVDSYFLGCGDWIFSSALYDDPSWRLDEFERVMQNKISSEHILMSRLLHELSPQFVRDMAERIAALQPDIVGFTSTFQQNTASLATARYVKELAPHVRTVMGGANCDGVQGSAIHRNFPCIDYVVRGEGEIAFPQLLQALRQGDDVRDISGLCWRAGDGTSRANPMSTRPLPPAVLVPPDYDGYFARLATSRSATRVQPTTVVEGSRGCWWGEKHHCTFCGLNGSSMEFRSKTPEQFYSEIVTIAERHRVLDLLVVDNILDMTYLTTLVPMMIESGHDFRLWFEVKSNLRRHQLEKLRQSGITIVQCGIENLNSTVLGLMRKGVTGCQNVRFLRDALSAGILPRWNYLYGFPGESAGEYDSVSEQLPALHHLVPPDNLTRICVERFSPYFNQPELGFDDIRPGAHYSCIYDLPLSEIADLAYVFDASWRGISEDIADRFRQAVDEWRAVYQESRLTYCDLGDRIVLVSRRPHYDWNVQCIDDPIGLVAFRLLDDPHKVVSLARKASERRGCSVSPGEISTLLAQWQDLGLLFQEAGQFIHVAAEASNQELLRVTGTHHGESSGAQLQPI